MSFIHPVILTSESTIHRRSKQHIKLSTRGSTTCQQQAGQQSLICEVSKAVDRSNKITLNIWPLSMARRNAVIQSGKGNHWWQNAVSNKLCFYWQFFFIHYHAIRRGMHSMYLEQEMKVKKWKLKLTLTTLKLLNGNAVYILPQATDPCKCLELLIVPYVLINSRLQKLQVKC